MTNDGQDKRVAGQVMVALEGQTGFVRVVGRGTFNISPAFKDFGLLALHAGARRLVIDMYKTIGLDSTFMGVLAGLATRFMDVSGQVMVINLSAHTQRLLTTLGVDTLLECHLASATPPEWNEKFGAATGFTPLASGDARDRATADTILQAHETLVEILPENRLKFQDVLQFLKDDLRQRSGAPEPGRGPPGP